MHRSHIVSRGVLRGRSTLYSGHSSIYTQRSFKPTCIVSQIRHTQTASEAGEAGEDDTGHIEARPNEGILFFGNVFPLRFKWLVFPPWTFFTTSHFQRIQRLTTAAINPSEVVKHAIPDNTTADVTGVIPNLREGGVFVRFTHNDRITAKQIETSVKEYLTQHNNRPWFNPLSRVRAGLVVGRPWIEDLFRQPSQRLRVEFQPLTGNEPVELSQERLYSLFRPYGKLLEIVKQPPDSKVLPKFAYLDFATTQRAIMAKACLHGLAVAEEESGEPKSKIKITFELRPRKSWFFDWIFNHPRIVIPILVALIAGFTTVVVDPIRTWNIKLHVTKKLDLSQNKLYRWFTARATDLLSFGKARQNDSNMDALVERRDDVDILQRWLTETADTFIVVQGPRGSGKRELILKQALKDRKNVLVIDCKPIQEARGDSKTISAAADQLGYKPVFSWTNNFGGLIDLAVQGATGVKAGLSETLDTQLNKILNNTATALKQIALDNRAKEKGDVKTTDDVYLETHPERLPVVVIDNFLHRNQEDSLIYDRLAEWAARLATSNIAHVIFLTTDVAYSKALSKALPDRIFHSLTLGDIPSDTAKRFVISHVDSDPEDAEALNEKGLSPSQRRTDLGELDGVISTLGGRLTDLEFLARRIKAGESPNRAVREIIDQAASEIMKMYILAGDKQWAPEQAWLLVKRLASSEALRYNEIILSDAFKGSNADQVLQALEQAEMITIVSSNGRPSAIRAAKPVYQSAFRRLLQDQVLSSRLDLALLSKQIKLENQTVESSETELKVLGKLPKQPPELSARIQWLLGKLQDSQTKIEQYEHESARLKKILQNEF